MLDIIVSCEDSALYVKVEDENLVLVTSSEEATKFRSDYDLDKILAKARQSFDKQFTVASVSDNFFGLKPRFVYEAGDESDTYLCSFNSSSFNLYV